MFLQSIKVQCAGGNILAWIKERPTVKLETVLFLLAIFNKCHATGTSTRALFF